MTYFHGLLGLCDFLNKGNDNFDEQLLDLGKLWGVFFVFFLFI